MPFWTLPWRRNTQASNLTGFDEADLCHHLPDVTHSNSSETSSTIHDDVHYAKTPSTPEGLRPRPSTKTLRMELKIDTDNRSKRDFLVEKKVETSRMLPAAPSRSWSMPSQPSLPQFGVVAPGTNNIESILDFGKAQTAVGNFVVRCQDESSRPSSPHGGGYDGDADRSHCNIDSQRWLKQSIIGEEWDEKKEDQNEYINPVYYPLEKDPIFLSRTPPPTLLAKRHLPLIPYSTNISLEASPSSLAKPYSRVEKPAANHNTSFSSETALIAHPESNRYDFGRYGTSQTKEIHVKIASDQTHVSAMTQSVVLENDTSGRDAPETCESEEGSSNCWGDDSLRRQKVQNQRRLKEELLLAIVERLQDDVQLVRDIYKVNANALQATWSVETPLDQEGLLTGFSSDKRCFITRQLSDMLNEIDVAQPEDFFLSPSQVQQYVQPHDELLSAIAFCRTLVQMAPPNENDGRWNLLPGFRAAMGITSHETPRDRPRGSDTSLFTLPSGSDQTQTPMTSNVSFSTTIASSKQTSRQPHLRVDGLQVRHTIEVLSSLLHKLSLSCIALANMNQLETGKTVRITKQIKRYYQQLLAVDHNLLRSLVDAFAFEIALPELTQLVSNDDEIEENGQVGGCAINEARAVVVPPPRVIRNSFPHARTQTASPRTGDFFSPQTMDMMSDRVTPSTVPEEYDDLRRQVGSVDYDDDDWEVREGPDACERE
eukprot:scaffold392_cov177-Amphora_coffeaeformis.AAC.11